MSKTTTVPTPADIEKANDSMNKILIGAESPLTFEEAFDILDRADAKGMQNLTSEYYSFDEAKKGDVFNFLFTGFEVIKLVQNGTPKDVECVKLVNREKKQYVCGSAVLVSACKRIKEIPTYIKVTYLGTVKNNNGTYADLQVNTF